MKKTIRIQCEEKMVHQFGGEESDYERVFEWFDEAAHPALRHHTAGIFQCEEKIGTVIINKKGKKVPVRYIGELYVKEQYGFIPTPQEWIENVPLTSWMGYRNKALNRQFKKQ